MRWIAQSEKDDANHLLEKRLWDSVGPSWRFSFRRLSTANAENY